MAHQTTTPEQAQTDTFAVFDSVWNNPNLELIARVEVPRYTQPNSEGTRISTEDRKRLAVKRAVESDDSFVSNGTGSEMDDAVIAGHKFPVLTEIDGEMDKVIYVQETEMEPVWNPEE